MSARVPWSSSIPDSGYFRKEVHECIIILNVRSRSRSLPKTHSFHSLKSFLTHRFARSFGLRVNPLRVVMPVNHVYSCTYGRLKLEEAILKIRDFTEEEGRYDLFVGTDSQVENGKTLFVTSIVVHRVTKGAIFFINSRLTERVFTIRDRLIEEAYRSLQMAQRINELGAVLGCEICSDVKCLTIDADVGEGGASRDVIRAIVGMVAAFGYSCRFKPECSTIKVADKYTKVRVPAEPAPAPAT
ncbi:MAG TPA: hypothetical protein DCE03_00160 [Synergistaceae bacterium]|nr:hypothetical protein [Synergistaceae bacterium]